MSEKNTSCLITGADMDNLSVKSYSFREMTVTACVTAGVRGNALKMSKDNGGYYEPGTINIIIMSNMQLSKRAMTRAIISATEAKSAALADLDIRSTYSAANTKWIFMLIPHQVLAELSEKGETWAVVQSMHLIGGHEFFRLVNEVNDSEVRVSIGLPLLSSPDDFNRTGKALEERINNGKEEAIVFVGHGTDHMAWSSYPALAHVLQNSYGNRVFVGVVEGFPEAEDIAETVLNKGYRKARIVPFMLVAGVHFYEDLASDDEDSWKSIFEAKGISVVLENEGVGYNDRITDIFCDHISSALDMIR